MGRHLRDKDWKCEYSSGDGSLLKEFYIPALQCATRYDRTTGFFMAESLAAAAVGIEALVENGGHMRLITGCTLYPEEIDAILRGEDLKEAVNAHFLANPLDEKNESSVHDALELLSWLVANGVLEVKVAVPCDPQGRPCKTNAIFHDKTGIIEDEVHDRIAFTGSLNETLSGWSKNWESFTVFSSWDSRKYLASKEDRFRTLWGDTDKAAKVMSLTAAMERDLLSYLPPNNEMPKRLREKTEPIIEPESIVEPEPEVTTLSPDETPVMNDSYEAVWTKIANGPAMQGGGEFVGEATSAITPWAHQIHAFERMYNTWPPHLLIADEVGLGKTIQAGLIIRQAWLSGKAKRILLLVPKSVLYQWQLELREKFNLNVPVYDGNVLKWCATPALQGKQLIKVCTGDEWKQEPLLLTSSSLMKRRDRSAQLLKAEPWDLVVLDEAHYARRKNAAKGAERDDPNMLLRLMRQLKDRTAGLLLLTATPMQVSPIEVYDLLSLLGLPEDWSADHFMRFFEATAHQAPGDVELHLMKDLFVSMESMYGKMEKKDIESLSPDTIAADRVERGLHGNGYIRLRSLSLDDRRLMQRVVKAYCPTKKLISRHTRELLKRYKKAGKLAMNIADRDVQDYLVDLSVDERALYDAMEDYISSTYNNATQEQKTAVGFVMTIYRRRLASSFYALRQTLQGRLDRLTAQNERLLAYLNPAVAEFTAQENASDDETIDDQMEADDVTALEVLSLVSEEKGEIERLLEAVKRLPTDTKAQALIDVITNFRKEGYQQAIVFTQFTDTLDFLRDQLNDVSNGVLCYSGRGGEVWNGNRWETVSREKAKALFRDGAADILVCTDAAAEGLNFQFCGVLINYDMPWNPMKVEQRIGRIDRLGQKFDKIHIVNLMYRDTVEADVYQALQERIGLFSTFVGGLQPILSDLPKKFTSLVLAKKNTHGDMEKRLPDDPLADMKQKIKEQKESGFDIDELCDDSMDMPDRPAPAYDLKFLDSVLSNSKLMPPGYSAKRLRGHEYEYLAPGSRSAIRVTTDRDYYEAHPESIELWSPGSPAFPWKEAQRFNRQ